MKTAKPGVLVIMSSLLIFLLLLGISCARQEEVNEEERVQVQVEENVPVEEGEESGILYTQDEELEEVRRGVKLHLTYDKSSSTFIGTMTNISEKPATRARVEVHLSNKVELGPTTPVDLAPGEQADVKLSAEGQSFTEWSAHAEVGSSEHGSGEEGEHASGEDGEHGSGEEGENGHR